MPSIAPVSPVQPRVRLLGLLLGLLLATAAPAQQPSSWTPLSPPGGVDASKLQFGHKVMLYRDGLYMRVYSAITRKWYAHQPSFGTTVQVRDNLIAVPESDRWTAFSPYTGTFAVLPINFATTTWQAGESLFAVRDGGTAHVFSIYTGQWHSHAVPASWWMTIEDRAVTFQHLSAQNPSDGGAAFDGVNGTWLDFPDRNETLGVAASGGTIVARYASEVLRYSGQRPWLESLPVQATSGAGNTINNRTDLVNFGGSVYSGLTSGWAAPPFPPPPFGNSPHYEINGLVVRASQINQAPLVLGASGIWHSFGVGSGTFSGLGVTTLLLHSGNDIHAFSSCTDQIVVRTLSAPPTGFDVRDHVSLVVDSLTLRPAIFSGLTGQWYDAPPDTLPVAAPSPNYGMSDTGVVLRTTTGLTGFSAHTGTFAPLTGTGFTLIAGHSCALGAWNGTTLYAFDSAKAQWLQTPVAVTGAQLPRVSTVGWPSTTLLAEDSTQAVGFAARTGRLEVLPLAEPVLARDVRGDIAWVRTASTIHAFSGFGDDVAWMGLPFDLIGTGRGSTLKHQLRLGNGDAALLGLGPRAAAPVALPPLGLIWLDLAFIQVQFFVGTPGQERVLLSVPVPDDPVLRATEWFLQPLMGPAVGAPYIAEPIPFRVL